MLQHPDYSPISRKPIIFLPDDEKSDVLSNLLAEEYQFFRENESGRKKKSKAKTTTKVYDDYTSS